MVYSGDKAIKRKPSIDETMVKIRTIQVRLTRQQYDRVKNDSVEKGFGTLSSYFRYLALHREQAISKMIIQIHDSVVGNDPQANKIRERTQDETIKRCL